MFAFTLSLLAYAKVCMFLHIHTRACHVKTNLHINSNVSTFQTAPLNGGTFRVISGAKSAGRYVRNNEIFKSIFIAFKAIKRITKIKITL